MTLDWRELSRKWEKRAHNWQRVALEAHLELTEGNITEALDILGDALREAGRLERGGNQ